MQNSWWLHTSDRSVQILAKFFGPEHFWTNLPVLYRVASIMTAVGTHSHIATETTRVIAMITMMADVKVLQLKRKFLKRNSSLRKQGSLSVKHAYYF